MWLKITKVAETNLYYYVSKTLIMLTAEKQSFKIGRIWNQAQPSLIAAIKDISMGALEIALDSTWRRQSNVAGIIKKSLYY